MNRLDNRSVVKQGVELHKFKNPKASVATRAFASDAALNKRTFQTALQHSQQRQTATKKTKKPTVVGHAAKQDITKPLQPTHQQSDQTLEKAAEALDQIEQDNANTSADTVAQTEKKGKASGEAVKAEEGKETEQAATLDQTEVTEALNGLQGLLAQVQALVSQTGGGHASQQVSDDLPQLQLEVHTLAIKQLHHALLNEGENTDMPIKEMSAEQLAQFKQLLTALNGELKQLTGMPKQTQLKSLNGILQTLQGQIVSTLNKVDGVANKGEQTQANGELVTGTVSAQKQSFAKADQTNLQDSAQKEQQAEPKEQGKTASRINTEVKPSDTKFDVPVVQEKAIDIAIDQLGKANNKINDMRALTRTNVFEQVKEAIVKQSISVSDHSEMVIKLKPEELGKVELKIEVHNENVIAKFNVASQMVKEAIESNLADLKNSLKDKGFSDMAFDVNVQKDNSNRGQPQHGQGGHRRTVVTMVDREMTSDTYIKTLSGMLNETTFEHLA